jgi:hypothetical protein
MFDVTGSPIDTAHLGKDLRMAAQRAVIAKVGFNPLTDALLAKYFSRTEPIAAQKHANASARFVELIGAGKVRWEDAYAVGADLDRTTKREHDASGSFEAVRADDEPITALLAALRALWLASQPARESSGTKPAPSAMGF